LFFILTKGHHDGSSLLYMILFIASLIIDSILHNGLEPKDEFTK